MYMFVYIIYVYACISTNSIQNVLYVYLYTLILCLRIRTYACVDMCKTIS